ncbi:RICIN domain-containing protein [Actinokineospora soli]|uniref:RICIN domain-containing protein n=1 Tax=Actinokineospora soli TaxID=1048753 RepID=A0ABW2TRU2_9PSEU
MLKHDASGRCADVANAATTPDAAVVLWDCHGRSNQLWWRQ